MPEKIIKPLHLKCISGRIEIQGSSTLLQFSAFTTDVRISAQLIPSRGFEADILLGHLQHFVLQAPVMALHASDPTLQKHLHQTLKAPEFPEIRATIQSYDLRSDPKRVHLERIFGALIELSIAGVTKTVPMTASVQIHKKTLKIHGKKRIFMKDFGITPPVHMLGAVRVANEVDVLFDLEIGG